MHARRHFVAGAAAVLLLLGGCGTAPASRPAGPAATAAVSPDFNATDVTFVRTLIPHHRQGIEIAAIGAERASRAEVRVLANAIVATQEDEATRMQGWLETWKQQPAAASGAPDTGEAIAGLRKASGTAADKAFLDLLIAHQKEAIQLARTESEGGRNPNALAFARQVQESRAAEIEQLEGYRSQ